MVKRNGPAKAADTLAGPTWAPVLTTLQVAERERLVSGSSDLAVASRVSLHVLTRTAAELQAAWTTPEGMDAMTAATGMVMLWRDYLTEAAELADLALDRLAITGKVAASAAKVVRS